MDVLVTCKYEEDPIKMKALEWTQHFPHYNSMVAMETSGRIWPNFELIQALIHVLITANMKRIGEAILMNTHNIGFYEEISKIIT